MDKCGVSLSALLYDAICDDECIRSRMLFYVCQWQIEICTDGHVRHQGNGITEHLVADHKTRKLTRI